MSETRRPLTLTALEPGMAEVCAAMTFPAYRHLLSLEPAPRHPKEGDQRIVDARVLDASGS